MARIVQPQGTRGSLKWIQRAVNRPLRELDAQILQAGVPGERIHWSSPLEADDFAEYRDASVLRQLNIAGLDSALGAFWPARGPQWDALGQSDRGVRLIVEAKAHIDEMLSPPTQAGPISREKIDRALVHTQSALGAHPQASWSACFYQIANRLAFLNFLTEHGVDARLIFVNFIGDADMQVPDMRESWESAYRVIWHIMGLPKRHKLAAKIVHVYPDVRSLG